MSSALLSEILKELSPYPLVQIFAVVMMGMFGLLGIWAWKQGEKDRKSGLGQSNVEIPTFLVIGPARDAIESIHHISEATRQSNERLERIGELLTESASDHKAQKEVLSDILRHISSGHVKSK